MTDTASRLTYTMLQNGVMGEGQSARFPEQRRTDVKRWLAGAYQSVWDAADWTFKSVYQEPLPLTADEARPTLPALYASTLGVYDDQGARLPCLQPEQFQDLYPVSGSRARPAAYMQAARRIVLGPVPDTNYTFYLSYRVRMSVRDQNGNPIAGFFDDALGDGTPYWDDHHYILIPRAQVIGLKTLNDPSWPQLDDEFKNLFTGMLADYLDTPPEPLQYGRDRL